ncbi:SWIRM domain-containing protein FUN19 [Staphylotrichum tortipilum]|uniref:SWIRM domain-containing protein FUN19 n=1 Tax=Staphylotrichum tortipilum TaxID=2831512 RepID=A0AAN6MPA4_9PEZI|nr:SWIRM domain-containing protein FUN19 [Staphylotrichum longicolle]
MHRPVSREGHRTTPRPSWAPSSSPPTYFPPTPTKEMQDVCAQPLDRSSSMAPKLQKPCDISNLMSPPEPAPLDMFRPATIVSGKPTAGPVPHQPLSPPVSPFSHAANTISPTPLLNLGGKDPILFPAVEAPASVPTGPLFTPAPAPVATAPRTPTERLVSEHIASRPAGLFRDSTPPRPEDYELALYFKSNCFRMFRDNPKEWLRKERELLRADRKHTALTFTAPSRLPHILPAARPTAVRPAVLGPQSTKAPTVRVQKPKSPKAKAQNPRPIRATPTTAPATASARESIRVGTPEPRVRTVAPNREDKDFAALQDLAPPVSTLPPRANSLKVDWKGNALDLSADPHRHLLHPDELALASNLRLDCATYLTSKRRIFLRRLECARIGKEFRKTDAQQACKIDVNKASKLWQAYERVGWLDVEWMREFLKR